jgi:hypothetical protein
VLGALVHRSKTECHCRPEDCRNTSTVVCCEGYRTIASRLLGHVHILAVGTAAFKVDHFASPFLAVST